jgi:hypothetical protein
VNGGIGTKCLRWDVNGASNSQVAPAPSLSYQDFRGRWVAQEPLRTCRGTVGARLEYYDDVAWLRIRHLHAVSEQVQWRTKRTDH